MSNEEHDPTQGTPDIPYAKLLGALVAAKQLSGAEFIDGNAAADQAASLMKFVSAPKKYGSKAWAQSLADQGAYTFQYWYTLPAAKAARAERGEADEESSSLA